MVLRKEERPLAVYHVYVMRGLFLLFDARIFLMVNLSRESPVTGTIPISLGKRVIYHGKSVQCNLTYCIIKGLKHVHS